MLLSKAFYQNKLDTQRRKSMCLSHKCASINMWHDLPSSKVDLDLDPISNIKLAFWGHQWYHLIPLEETKTMVGTYFFLYIHSVRSLTRKTIFLKLSFFIWCPLELQPWNLDQVWWSLLLHLVTGCLLLFRVCSSYRSFRYIADFVQKCSFLGKFDLFDSWWPSFWPDRKMASVVSVDIVWCCLQGVP